MVGTKGMEKRICIWVIEEIKTESKEQSNIYHRLDHQHSWKQKAKKNHDQNIITHYQKTIYTMVVDMQ